MKEITKLIKIMEEIRKNIYAEMPVQQIHILLTVADNPGITLPELSDALHMNQGTTSRNVKVMGRYMEKSDAPGKEGRKHAEIKGHDLLHTQPDLYNRKSLAVFLTKKGEKVVRQLAKIVTVPPPRPREAN